MEASGSSTSVGSSGGSRKRGFEEADGLVEPTETNPLGLAESVLPHGQKYRVITMEPHTFGDVVAEPDLDMLRKMAQIWLAFNSSKKTLKMYVVYDERDQSYEVIFECPPDQALSFEFLSCLYRVNPMLIVAGPYFDAERNLLEDGTIDVVKTVAIRYASYRRRFLTIKNTMLMMYETEATVVRTSDHVKGADGRPAKRLRTLNTVYMPAADGALPLSGSAPAPSKQ